MHIVPVRTRYADRYRIMQMFAVILICVGIGSLDCEMPYRASDIAEIPRGPEGV